MDYNWIYTIIEVSATFVAVTAGFLTAKIISIASERGNIKTDIEMLDTNILSKEENIQALEKRIDAIGFKWAEEGFRFIKEKIKGALKRVDAKPPIELIIEVFSKRENLDRYDESLIEERYDALWDEVEAEKEAERKEEEKRKKEQERLAKSPLLSGLLGTLDWSSLLESMNYASRLADFPIVSLADQGIRISEREEFRRLSKEREEEIVLKNTYEAQRNILVNKIPKIYLPKYLWFGLFSLGFFSLVGVIAPLLIVTNIEIFMIAGKLTNQTAIIVLFILALICNLGYLCIEINESVKI